MMRRELIKLAINEHHRIFDGDGTVLCYRIGALALHNVTPYGDLTWNWMVSHIPTGRLIMGLPVEMKFRVAKQFTAQLSVSVDWASMTIETAFDLRFKMRDLINSLLLNYVEHVDAGEVHDEIDL